jgi:hypothetical protein
VLHALGPHPAQRLSIRGRGQVSDPANLAPAHWARWLAKNFDLSDKAARVYMQWAREQNAQGVREVPYTSMRQMTGNTQREREQRQSTQRQAFHRVLHDVARDDFVQERQAGITHPSPVRARN